ncbi:MAG: hypothetical protein VKK42_02810 [Lyngbya sp.]|nr:hypothetical protein [Lyngbya sp.]
MTTFNPGTGGSLQATTQEGQVWGAVLFLQKVEADSAKNVNGANLVTSTVDQDDNTASISGTIPCFASIGGAGGTNYAYTDPYLNANFVEGTGGDGTASNILAAVAERVMMLYLSQMNQAKNPNAVILVESFTHTVATSSEAGFIGANATLSFSLSLPTTMNFNGVEEVRVAREIFGND